jgi:TP901 family phage tail tape measure protein
MVAKGGDLGKVTVELEAIDNISKTLGNVQTQMRMMQGDIKKTTRSTAGLGKAFGSLGDKFKTGITLGLGFQAVNFAINAITSSLNQAISSAIAWEAAMWRIQTVTGNLVSTETELNGVMASTEEHLKRIADNSFFGRAETVSAFTEFAKQGFETVDALNALEAAQALAIVGLTDMNTAIHITAVTLRAFNLEATEAWRVTDVLAQAANVSALDVEDFGTALGYAGAFARNAGYSIEETSAILATLSNQGLEASKAGVYLRQTFIQMSSPTNTAKEAMDKLGVSFVTASGQFKDMGAITGELNQAFIKLGYTDFEKTQTLIDIFGARASTAMLMLTNNVDELNKSFMAMEEAGGTAQEALERYADTAEGAIKKAQARTEGTLQDFGAMVNETAGNIIRGASRFLDPIWEARERSQEVASDIRRQYTELGIDTGLWARETKKLTEELTYMYASTKAGSVSMQEYAATMMTLQDEAVTLEEKLALLQEAGVDFADGESILSKYNTTLHSLTKQSELLTGNYDGLIQKNDELADTLHYIAEAEGVGQFYDEKTLVALERAVADTWNYANAIEDILRDDGLVKAYADRAKISEDAARAEIENNLNLYREYNDRIEEINEATRGDPEERARQIAAASAQYSDAIIEANKKTKDSFGELDPSSFLGEAWGKAAEAIDQYTDKLAELEYLTTTYIGDISLAEILGVDEAQVELDAAREKLDALIKTISTESLTEEGKIRIEAQIADTAGLVERLQREVEGQELILGAKFKTTKVSQSEIEKQFKQIVGDELLDEKLFRIKLNIPYGELKRQARDTAKETGRSFEDVFKELQIEAVMDEMTGGFEDAALAEQEFEKNLESLKKQYTELAELGEETSEILIGGFTAGDLGLSDADIAAIKEIQEAARAEEIEDTAEKVRAALDAYGESDDAGEALNELAVATGEAGETSEDALVALEQSGKELVDYMSDEFLEGWSNVWQGAVNIAEEAANLIQEGLEETLNKVVKGINEFISDYNSIARDLGLDTIGKLGSVDLGGRVEFGEIQFEVVVESNLVLDGEVAARAVNEANANNQGYV